MNFLYLSPQFPPNYRDFVRGLKEVGAQVLGVGETPADQLPPELRSWMHDYQCLPSLQDYDALYRCCAGLIHRHGRLDRVDSNSEFWMETEARLRQDFNLSNGYQPAQVQAIKSKWSMKERYRAGGVPVADGCPATSLEEARALVERCGYPLVAKPDIGVGAAATYRIHGEKELITFFLVQKPGPYIFEEYLEGTLCTYDGLVNADGQVLFSASHFFADGLMDVVNQESNLYYCSERTLPPDLEALGQATLRAFDVRQRFFHLEFIRTPKGLRALEANLRAPGAHTVNMMCYANDADVFRGWADLVCHNRCDIPCRRPYHVAYLGRRDRLTYQIPHEEVLGQYHHLLMHHLRTEEVFRKATGDYAYILRSPDLDTLQAAAQAILA